MSLKELETALRTVPLQEARRLRRILDARLSGEAGGDGATEQHQDRTDVDIRRRELAKEINWTGGEGLQYQLRVRSEWDDRPGVGN